MKTLCYLVKLSSLYQISPKAYLARCFDGSEAVIPKSQVFGKDFSSKTDAYWISAWILSKTRLQYSDKRKAMFDDEGKMYPYVEVKKYTPQKVNPVASNEQAELKR